jgi:uncharacterized protein YecE (DUF72 family)
MLFERSRISSIAGRLFTDHGVAVGTSSWRYEGWCGMLYDEDRYLWGTHFSKKRFSDHCLEEYGGTFPTVCVDSSYYAIPKTSVLEGMKSQVSPEFLFSFKVPDDITIKRFPNASKFGKKAGKENELFLSDGLFKMGFLRQLEKIRDQVGVLIFEFSHFHPSEFEHGREFVDALDVFLGKLPDDWRYAVEIRNHTWLHPDYFEMLKRHGVAHVYNHWTRMPPVSEQITVHPLEDNPFVVARYLLTPGRSFQFARDQFEPFHHLREIDRDARESMGRILHHGVFGAGDLPVFLYIGNELEGNALHTIADVLEGMETELGEGGGPT